MVGWMGGVFNAIHSDGMWRRLSDGRMGRSGWEIAGGGAGSER